ncbi:MAG: thioredoxin family protein [Microscillaceae bacterium]|nr:thioredoxin family protein [Microscillaceae bacterium]MDW8461753.1 thioredoxin family protein [Cytophagales bacterium]
MLKPQTIITQAVLQQAMSYKDYLRLTMELLAQNRTTGENQSEFMINYTRQNLERMQRIDNEIDLLDSTKQILAQINTQWIWLVITEPWCGDAAQIVPILEKMATFCPFISHKIILRDLHLPIIDAYLTNGGRSIPKLICLDAATLHEVGNWGPRPAEVQKIVEELKTKQTPLKEAVKIVHAWYDNDRTVCTQTELCQQIDLWLKQYA